MSVVKHQFLHHVITISAFSPPLLWLVSFSKCQRASDCLPIVIRLEENLFILVLTFAQVDILSQQIFQCPHIAALVALNRLCVRVIPCVGVFDF
jgi:hypothetical protein